MKEAISNIVFTMLIIVTYGCNAKDSTPHDDALYDSAKTTASNAKGGSSESLGNNTRTDQENAPVNPTATSLAEQDAAFPVNATEASVAVRDAGQVSAETDAALSLVTDVDKPQVSDAYIDALEAGTESKILDSSADAQETSDATTGQPTDSGPVEADSGCPRESVVSVACGSEECTGATPLCCIDGPTLMGERHCVASRLFCLNGDVAECDDWSDCAIGQRCYSAYNKGLSIYYPPTCHDPQVTIANCIYKNKCECEL